MEICRQAQTGEERQVTLSGDEIIGNVSENNMDLIPIVVSPHGRIGNPFVFFVRRSVLPNGFPFRQPPQRQAEALACSICTISVPYGIVERAKKMWKKENPDIAYDQKLHFQQKLGLVISTSISS